MAAPSTPAAPDTQSRAPFFSFGPVAATSAAFGGLTVLFLAVALVIAIALPYGEWDSMSFGTWSRLIADHWPHLRFAGIGEADYHRPLFYVLQGTVWSIFGFHQ